MAADLSVSMRVDKSSDRNKGHRHGLPARMPNTWIPDCRVKRCFNCAIEFSMFKRKHHCRSCGRIFCHSCSSYKVTPPTYGDKAKGKQRMCAPCAKKAREVKEIEWLAGRGYNTFGVSVPATYKGQRDIVHGDFTLVLWENMADPIITGREDLGIAKLYCEIPEPQIIGDKVICRASWDGCQFASLVLSGVKEITPEELPEPLPSEGDLHYKYIPKTSAPGEADVAYPVLTPAEWTNVKIDQAMVAENAVCNFRESTWEELPTLVHIVNTLSALTLGDCVEAKLFKSHGSKDLSDQRILG